MICRSLHTVVKVFGFNRYCTSTKTIINNNKELSVLSFGIVGSLPWIIYPTVRKRKQ